MNGLEMFSQWAGIWADYMGERMLESTLVFLIVSIVWLMVRK